MKSLVQIVVASAFACASAAYAAAQTGPHARQPRVGAGSATIVGTVVDDSGAALPGAMVILSTDSGDNPREATSDATGRFVFTNVAAGPANLHAELPGFQAVDLELTVGTNGTAE